MNGFDYNAAYDLRTFDARSSKEAKKEVAEVVQKKKTAAVTRSFACIAGAVIVFVVIFTGYIWGYTLLNEQNAKIASLKSSLEDLSSEFTSLSVRYDAMVDLNSVEQLAIYEYGMNKLDKTNVQYISINSTDQSVAYGEDKSLLEKIPTAFRRLSAFFEYFA